MGFTDRPVSNVPRSQYELHESYGSWTGTHTLSLSNDMHFTTCTTHKPLFHDSYELYESYGLWTCIYTLTFSNDIYFINCTTRKPLFHDSYELYESYGSWACTYTLSPSNDMQFTNCTTRKPWLHDLYDPYGSCKKEDAIIRVVSVRVYWTTLQKTMELRSFWNSQINC